MTDLGLARRARRVGSLGWAVIAVLVVGTAAAAATGNGNGNGNGNPGHAITVTGTSPTGLSPGATKPVTVTISNPNQQDAQVTSVTITVGNASSSCPAAGNITVTSYDSARRGALVYIAPKNGSVQVPLSITMLDPHASQDTCKSKSFPLTFNATVTNKN
jgi:hypothetical protein